MLCQKWILCIGGLFKEITLVGGRGAFWEKYFVCSKSNKESEDSHFYFYLTFGSTV